MRRVKSRSVLRSASICLGALALVVSLHKLSDAYELKVHGLVWFSVGVALGVVWHEAGHLICATLGSIPVRLMSVGVGPLLWRSHVGDVRFDLRLLPIGGMVESYPLLIFRKYRMLVFVLGGILGNCALVAVMTLLALIGAVHESADFTLRAVVAAQYFLIATNLYPFRAKVDGVRLPSDGLQVLKLLLAPRKVLTEAGAVYRDMLTPYLGSHNHEPVFSLAAPRILYQLMRQDIFADSGALQDYRKMLERELAGDLSSEEELLILEALVTIGLISGDPAFRERLDAWSQRASELAPHAPTVRSSRGAVLVDLGHWEEGKDMLSQVAAIEGSFDLLMTQVSLARAEYALGNTAAAEALVEAARKTGEAHEHSSVVTVLLPRLKAEMSA